MEKAEAKGVKFLLPEDVVVADKARLSSPSFRSKIIRALRRSLEHSNRGAVMTFTAGEYLLDVFALIRGGDPRGGTLPVGGNLLPPQSAPLV